MLNNKLLPTAYLAPIGYYAILLQCKNYMFEYHENFIKQSIRNRCEILAANGKLNLIIPRKHKANIKTKISEIKISYSQDWQKIHWKSIESAYNSSPFFEFYKNQLKPYYFKEEIYLIDFNKKIQFEILKMINEKIEHKTSSKYNKKGDFIDLRSSEFKSKIIEKYDQVFIEKHGFISNLSILDLLFNKGPETSDYLHNIQI